MQKILTRDEAAFYSSAIPPTVVEAIPVHERDYCYVCGDCLACAAARGEDTGAGTPGRIVCVGMGGSWSGHTWIEFADAQAGERG